MKFLTDYLGLPTNPDAPPPDFEPLSQTALVIVVGLTGVGKSTVTDLLQQQIDFTLLPNRRRITDEIIIASLQKADGDPVHSETDRLKRLEYTSRYRRAHPGGMAHALSRLAINPEKIARPIVFDGLRGEDEVRHATHYFPQARFIVLDAPDGVRLERLLNRGDSFDRVKLASVAGQDTLTALQAIPEIERVFTSNDLQRISRITADLAVDKVIEKAAIIVKERQNYDSQAARAYLLQKLPANRCLVVDTAIDSPAAVVKQIKKWLT